MAVQRKLQAQIIKIETYSDGVKLFRLKPFKRIPRFKPGQFLHLAIDDYDPSFNWPDSRVFSIANAPSRSEFLDLLISKKGKFTGRLYSLEVGAVVWVKLPFGIFDFQESLNNEIVLIAGGTGISPFISFLQHVIDNDRKDISIQLYYGIKNDNVLIIKELIKECHEKLPNFSYNLYVEDSHSRINNLDFNIGILPAKDIIKKSLSMNNPDYYLSGPPAMILAFENSLKENGIEESKIKFDKWE